MPAPMTMTSLVFVLIPGTLGREINGLACDGGVVVNPHPPCGRGVQKKRHPRSDIEKLGVV